MSSPTTDAKLRSIQAKDAKLLAQTQFPIVTVSATFREELKQFYGDHRDPQQRDVVFSRAHFSMALGVAVEAWLQAKKDGLKKKKKLFEQSLSISNPQQAWLVDPTNYVPSKEWSKIRSTEQIGRLLARNVILKWIKDQVDTVVRNKLPITSAITPPLLHTFQRVERPIISLHYEAGNILLGAGKRVVQVLTDPHVREQYLKYADLPTARFCVFDERTRAEFLEKAFLYKKQVNPDHIIVTGPPVDPRIVAAAQNKQPNKLHTRPLRICITTGGLGTNKDEVRQVLHQLFDLLRRRPHPIQILAYGGTNHDFSVMIEEIAKEERVKIGDVQDESAKFRFIHGKHIMQLNDMLITLGFPWADVCITKPSGDMAYDAAAAGCALLFLKSWGAWEDNIEAVFTQLGIGRKAIPEMITRQVEALQHQELSWFKEAQEAALNLPPLFREGSKNILQVAKNWK